DAGRVRVRPDGHGQARSRGGALPDDRLPQAVLRATGGGGREGRRPAVRPHVERGEEHSMESENKPRILIVEDHPLIAELVETRLRIEGMQAIKCTSGREALEVVDGELLDVVILDIMMPDVDGYEVLRHIRPRSTPPTLPVSFLPTK